MPLPPSDQSDPSHRLSLRAPRMGCPVPGWGWGLKVAPEQRSPEGGGLALNASCLRARITAPHPPGLLPLSSPPVGRMYMLRRHPLGTQREVPRVTFLPCISSQQAAVLGQGRGLLHPVPDPGGVVEPARGGRQSRAARLGPIPARAHVRPGCEPQLGHRKGPLLMGGGPGGLTAPSGEQN